MTGTPLVVGTAGHIDHGKTWLVRALTGKDTDRLPEERERGISIDLGYAPLVLPGGRSVSLVDVPGHELFIRNMVAGATGVDLFLLVIDAGEGARPQTHEHLAILRLLRVHDGVIALTKADAVDEETLALARSEAQELVPGATVVAVSAKTGAGLDELRAALAAASDLHERVPLFGATRLFLDRVFTLRGIGTVATGTLWSGSIGVGDELRAEPAGLDVRVRSVQVHDRPVERAVAGQRVAVGLPGVERQALARGHVLIAPGAYPVSFRLDVVLDELEPIPQGTRVQVHHGTAAVPARLVRADGPYGQLRLAARVVAARGDRVILRERTTLGGAMVLDPAPARRLDGERFRLLHEGDPRSIVRSTVEGPVTRDALVARGLLPPADLDDGLAALERAGDWFFTREWLDELRARVRGALEARARDSALEPGLPLSALLPREPWAPAVAPLLGLVQRDGRAYLPGVDASLGDRADAAARLEAALASAGANALKIDDRELARYLEREGRLVRLGDDFAVSASAYEEARRAVVAECERASSIRLARFRDVMGISRRPAQLLLERLDADGVTRRVGEERVLRRAASRR